MSAPYSNIETKVELAAKAHVQTITTKIPGVNFYAGVDSLNLDHSIIKFPAVIANADSSDEKIFKTGQYAVDLIMEVISSADDTTAAKHRERVAWVRDQFSNTWVGASLSTYVTDFTAVGVVLQKASQATADKHWITKIPMIVHCRPSD